MMSQAQGYRDVPSEPLGDFYYAMRIDTLPELPGRSKRGKQFFPSWSGVDEVPRFLLYATKAIVTTQLLSLMLG